MVSAVLCATHIEAGVGVENLPGQLCPFPKRWLHGVDQHCTASIAMLEARQPLAVQSAGIDGLFVHINGKDSCGLDSLRSLGLFSFRLPLPIHEKSTLHLLHHIARYQCETHALSYALKCTAVDPLP